jgi:hypothetical protein
MASIGTCCRKRVTKMTRKTHNIDPLLETVLQVREDGYSELSADVIRRLLEMHANPAVDDRSRFRAVRDMIQADTAE